MILLAQLLAIIFALSFLWLLVRAFSRSVPWGLGVLLLSPVSAVAFGVTFWKEEKKPFLLYLGSTFVAIALLLYLFTTWGGWELVISTARVQQGIAGQNLSTRDAEAFMRASQTFVENSGVEVRNPATLATIEVVLEQERIRLAAQKAEVEAEAEAGAGAKSAQDYLSSDTISKKVGTDEEPRYRLVYKTIPISNAHNYIGATMKVTRRNVQEKEYRLTGASAGALQFSQRNASGTYSFAFRNRDIEKLRVLIKEHY